MTRLAAIALLLATVAPAHALTEWLDHVDRALRVESPDGLLRAELSGLFDLEGYYIDQRPPGLIFGGGDSFVNPRLTLFLDAHLGKQLYGFVQARFDRGFDPRAPGGARADEWFLRWTPRADGVVNLQAGKFATVVGNWVPRHDSWQNPFINAPLPYENVTTISDGASADSPEELVARRHLPDKKYAWVPLIWGPSYATGLAAFGNVAWFDWAVEVKNASLSSRPKEWNPDVRGFDEPTGSARVGVRPDAMWAFGASASSGPYLRAQGERTLYDFADPGDVRQTVVGVDGRFAWRHLEVWSEVFLGRFDAPINCGFCKYTPAHVQDADTLAYYLEARYRHGAKLFTAVRWNQQFFGDIDDRSGGTVPWDNDAWRVDTAIGWRFDRHLQAKLQYSFSQQVGTLQQGEQLVAAQLTLKF